jgi:hypothetical protein
MSLAQLVHVALRGHAGLAPKACAQERGANFRTPKPAPCVEIPAAYGARTKAVLQLLRDGPATTPALAQALGMSTHAAGSLLKHCKQRGQVLRADGKWLINPEHQPAAVTRAATLLRRLGWTVTPPAAA